VIQGVGDWMLKSNKLSGAAHSVFVGGLSAPSLVGVDDKFHYDRNVQAYLDSISKKPSVLKELAADSARLENQKKSVFSPALKKFDADVAAYSEGKLPLTVYAQRLAAQQEIVDLNLQSFVEAAEMERSLNFKQVEGQRTEALSALLKHLSKEESQALLAKSVAYRTGETVTLISIIT